MAPRYEVKEVQDHGHYWQVLYDLTRDDGTVTGHGHSIPKDTLEWRAAEYGLDPETEFETILDVVLAEPYIAIDEQVGSVVGEELYDAPDIATARARHLARCARAKLTHRISTRKAIGKTTNGSIDVANPLDLIRNTAVIDPLVVKIKKEHVRQGREEHAKRARPETPNDRAQRIAANLRVDINALQGMKRNG